MAKKTSKSSKKSAQFDMTVAAAETTVGGMPGIAEQVAAMTGEEIVEESMTVDEEIAALMSSIGVADPNNEILEEAVSAAEREATTQALYAEQGANAAIPSESSSDTPTEAAPETKGKKAKAPKAPKAPKPPRMTYVTNKKSEVLLNQLGDKASDFLVLEVGDADLDTAALKAKQAELLALIDSKEDGGAAKKVSEKAVMLFKWLKSGGELNEVMKRAFTVLSKDGELTGGNKGNLQSNLLDKPYSPGTAASQANQMFMLFPLLKITVKEKGRMVPNPDSTIFKMAKAQLGL